MLRAVRTDLHTSELPTQRKGPHPVQGVEVPGGGGVKAVAERIEFDLPGGGAWLCVRARDGAGNLGRVSYLKPE